MFSSKNSQEILRSAGHRGEEIYDDGCNPAVQVPTHPKSRKRREYHDKRHIIEDRYKENIQEEASRLASSQASAQNEQGWGNRGNEEAGNIHDNSTRSIYLMMIPDEPYFQASFQRELFIALVEVEHLQFALLGVDKQIELMESLNLRDVEAGEVIYKNGDESSEFYIILRCKDRRLNNYSSDGKPCVELLEERSLHLQEEEKEEHDGDLENTNDGGLEYTKTLVYQDQIFGHDRFVFNKIEVQFRTHTATALEKIKVAYVYPDDYQKWMHFRHTIINDQKSKLEEEERKLTERFERNVHSLEKKLATLEEDHNLQIEYLEKQLIAADDLTGDIIFDDDNKMQMEQLRALEEREAKKVARLEAMLVSMFFSPPESQNAAALVQKRMEEEAMLVKRAEEEEKRRLLLAEEVSRVRVWQAVRERMDPTVENTVDGTMVCDINLFSRLSLLAERVKWYDQIPRARQDRYNAIFEECARILQQKVIVGEQDFTEENDCNACSNYDELGGGGGDECNVYSNQKSLSLSPSVTSFGSTPLTRSNSPQELYRTFLEIPRKVSINAMPAYKFVEREIKNTFARLSCDSQLVKFLMNRTIDDGMYKSLYRLLAMLSILYDYSPSMISYGANLLLRHPEKEAFSIFCLLMEERNLRILFLVNPECMVRYHREFDRHLRHHLPRVWNHFKTINYPTIDITIKWFQSCFLESNPGELSLCVTDMLAIGVTDTLLRVGLGIMAYLERHIILCRSTEIQNCFRVKTMSLKSTDILTYAFSVQLERYDLLADQELLLLLSPENLRDHYEYGDDSDEEVESMFVTSFNDSISNLISAEAAARISAEQLKREQERWEISCREFEAEVNRMHSIEFARRQRRLASICIDKLLCDGYSFEEALRLVAEKHPIGNSDGNEDGGNDVQEMFGSEEQIIAALCIQSIMRRCLAKKRFTEILTSLSHVCAVRVRRGQLCDQQNFPFLLVSASSLQQPGKCLSSCQSPPFSSNSSLVEINEEFILNFDSSDALITINVMNANTSKQVSKRNSNSSMGIDKLFTGQALINTSHLEQMNDNNRNEEIAVDVQVVANASFPLYNMYGRKTHSSIKKSGTSGKLVGNLSVGLCRLSPLKAQCGWFFELSTTVFGIIDAARIWVVVHQDSVLLYTSKYAGREGLHRVIHRSDVLDIRDRSFEGLDVNPLIIEMGGIELTIETDESTRSSPTMEEMDVDVTSLELLERSQTIGENNKVITSENFTIPQKMNKCETMVLAWGEDSRDIKGIWKQLLMK